MKKTNWIKAGRLGAAHKLSGEIKLHFEMDVVPKKLKHILVGKTEAQALPYQVVAMKPFTANAMIILLDEINTKELATKHSGNYVWMKETDLDFADYAVDETIIGFTIIDITLGELGKAKDIYQLPAQTIMEFDYNGKEIMLPCNQETIIKISRTKKEALIKLPDWLLDIY
jgi:16S rRNA processing protein RimM